MDRADRGISAHHASSGIVWRRASIGTVRVDPMRTTTAIRTRLRKQLTELEQKLAAATLDADAIHRSRVIVKKLRAWLRLLHQHRHSTHWQAADKALRQIARSLSEQRDDQVLGDTVLWLGSNSADVAARADCRKLHGLLPHTRKATRERPTVSAEIRQLCLPDRQLLQPTALLEGLRLAYARTRRLSRAALADPESPKTPEKLHRLRKWVKYLHYQLKLLFSGDDIELLQPGALDQLGSTLGRIHDLHELLRTLDKTPVKQQQTKATQRAMATAVRLADEAAARLIQDVAGKLPLLFCVKPKPYLALLQPGTRP
jgi:CHAD domain-containing protein